MATIATAALGVRAGWPWWAALLAAVLVANIHAAALAAEFLWLHSVRPGHGIPPPARRMLAKAWCGEVITGLRVFGWRQPFRSCAVCDEVHGSRKSQGVVLVHGFVCNRGLWNPWMKELRRSGIPYVAINLEPVWGPIDRYVDSIDAAVARLENATSRAPIIVSHSMGGLAVRAWLRDRAADHRVHSIITIGTPHAGTAMARLALSPNTRQMREGNEWLRALEGSETAERRRLFTCYFGHCDNIVFPASNAMLPDAVNHHVPGVAHVHLAFHRPILDDVLARAAQQAHGRGSAVEFVE